MSKAATSLWEKPHENAPWTKRFVVISDSVISIYNTREDYESQKEAIHKIKLSENTELIDGSDSIIYQGWLVKKGKLKWNARWCSLVNYGYMKYVDINETSDIRQIDFSKATFTLQKYENLIYWMYRGDRVYFRCDTAAIQKKWYQKMISIQENCVEKRIELKKKKLVHTEPTLFAFTVVNKSQKHYFSAANDKYLAAWKKCILEQISRSEPRTNIELKDDNKNIDIDIENKQPNIEVISTAAPVVTYITNSYMDENKSNSGSGSNSNSNSTDSHSDSNSNSNIENENENDNIQNDILQHKIEEIDNKANKDALTVKQNDEQFEIMYNTIIQQQDINDVVNYISGDAIEQSDVEIIHDNNDITHEIDNKTIFDTENVLNVETDTQEAMLEEIAVVENNNNGIIIESVKAIKNDECDDEEPEPENEETQVEDVKIDYDEYGTFVESECDGNDLKTCESFKRIMLILKIYKEHDEKYNNCFCRYLENIKCDLINDYHHILNMHLNEDKMTVTQSNQQFEILYRTIMQYNENELICDITKCNIYIKHVREREKNVIKYHDENLTIYMDILASIHCYFIHSVDFGFRMIVKPPIDDKNDSVAYDAEFASLKAYLSPIKKNLETIKTKNRFSNKFITETKFYENSEESKEEKNEENNVSYCCKDGEYNFGQHFEYWNGSKKPKYSTLKAEITANKIFCIDMDAFNEVFKKANVLLHNSNVIKAITSCKENKMNYKKGILLNEENIVCVILYTDYSILCYHFCETFKPNKSNECEQIIKERNYEYFNWSKILCETVNCFGISMNDSTISTLYHCVDWIYCEAFVAILNCPTSTTTRLLNAAVFVPNNGMILELKKNTKNSQSLRYFNCSFISYMGNEDERLFINPPSNYSLELVSIRNVSINENYIQFMEALSAFNKLIDKQYISNIDNALKVIINNLISYSISKYDETNYPIYILKSFQKWTDSKKFIVINLKLLKTFGVNLLFESDKAKNLLDFHRVNVIFKETTYLISEKVGFLSIQSLKSLLVIIDEMNKLKYSKVDKIYLYDIPNAHKFAATNDYAKYQTLFVKKNWKMQIKSGYSSDYLVVSK